MHKRPFSAISSRDPYIRGVISPISSAQRGSWLKYPRYARNGTRRAASRKHAAHGGGQTGSRGRTAGGQPGTRSARRARNEQRTANGERPRQGERGFLIAPWRQHRTMAAFRWNTAFSADPRIPSLAVSRAHQADTLFVEQF